MLSTQRGLEYDWFGDVSIKIQLDDRFQNLGCWPLTANAPAGNKNTVAAGTAFLCRHGTKFCRFTGLILLATPRFRPCQRIARFEFPPKLTTLGKLETIARAWQVNSVPLSRRESCFGRIQKPPDHHPITALRRRNLV